MHGADNLITLSKSDSKAQPPILEQDKAPFDEDEDTEPRLNTMATGASKENHDGLYSLDGPSPNLDNVEQHIFTIEDTIDVGSSYFFPPSQFNFADCSNGMRSACALNSKTTSTGSHHTKRG
jgi:hypothetical protein